MVFTFFSLTRRGLYHMIHISSTSTRISDAKNVVHHNINTMKWSVDVMFTMRAFKYVVPFWFSLIMGTVMTLALTYINAGFIPFPMVLRDILIAVCVAYGLGFIIPVNAWADRFAALFKAKNGSMHYVLATSAVFALFYTVVFSFLFTAIAIGFPPYFLAAAISGMPVGLIVGYIVGVAANPLALKLSLLVCSKKTDTAGATH